MATQQLNANIAINGKAGIEAIIEAASSKISQSATDINTLLTDFNPSDPGAMLKAQQTLAMYNLSLTVTASMIKSFEETAKSVAQKI